MVDVLIIDDDILFLELMHDFLTTQECTLRTFSSGEDAFTSIHDRLPDVLILDLMMPKYGGVSIYQELRATAHTATLPVIISTAAPQHTTKLQHLADDHFARVLSKPYHLNTLLTHIREMVTTHPHVRYAS